MHQEHARRNRFNIWDFEAYLIREVQRSCHWTTHWEDSVYSIIFDDVCIILYMWCAYNCIYTLGSWLSKLIHVATLPAPGHAWNDLQDVLLWIDNVACNTRPRQERFSSNRTWLAVISKTKNTSSFQYKQEKYGNSHIITPAAYICHGMQLSAKKKIPWNLELLEPPGCLR